MPGEVNTLICLLNGGFIKKFWSAIAIIVLVLCCKPLFAEKDKKENPAKKVLVVYYSQTRNTERVAKDIAAQMNADIEKIIDKKDRSGISGAAFSVKDAVAKKGTEIGVLEKDPSKYEMVIIGTPIWAENIPPAVRTYFVQTTGKIKKFACFAVSRKTNAKNIGTTLEELAGKKAIAVMELDKRSIDDSKAYSNKMLVFLKEVRSVVQK